MVLVGTVPSDTLVSSLSAANPVSFTDDSLQPISVCSNSKNPSEYCLVESL